MKNQQLIPVDENAKYNGQYMKWTEECTGIEKIKKGTILYHFSDKKLKSFLPKKTCFFLEDRSFGYCYIIKLKTDIEIKTYGSEIRINIDKNTKIYYVGRIYNKIDYTKEFPYPSKIIDNRKFN
jgi:hypothetical protein